MVLRRRMRTVAILQFEHETKIDVPIAEELSEFHQFYVHGDGKFDRCILKKS